MPLLLLSARKLNTSQKDLVATQYQGLGRPLTLRIKSDNSTNDVKLGRGVA